MPQQLAEHGEGSAPLTQAARRAAAVQRCSTGGVSALVAFSSSFVVVLAGLRAVGATEGQAVAGLMAVTVLMGLATIGLALSTRLPITVAWSTPGAALLASTGQVQGGWSAALGAFLVVAVLILATGLIPPLGDLVARIPTSVAQAMLAGVLLQLCLEPITGAVQHPAAVLPVVLVWLVGLRFFTRWAVPAAFLVAMVEIGVSMTRTGQGVAASALIPHVELTLPTFNVQAVVGLAIPLYLVTMASQNVAGAAVMKGLGYTVPWRRSLLVTGALSAVGAPAGSPGVNLAAISAAISAGPEAGEDRSRRWVSSVTSGGLLVVIGLAVAAVGALVGLAPEGLIPAVAGLALMGTLATSLRSALLGIEEILPAAATFAVVVSGISLLGMSAAFWGLAAGLAVRFVLRMGRN